ncbi:MAG: dUTP diphosphatase [Candidatus Pacearchaeota archaeon]
MNNKILKDIFEEQKEFQRYFYDPDNLSIEDKIKFTKEYILSIHRELGEVLNTLPWKLHRKEDKPISEANLTEEIIDCFKFLLNLCIIWGIDDEKFITEFFRKTGVVKQRFQQEILNTIKKNDKVCAIDLDDTLACTDEYFTKLYNEQKGTNYKNRDEIKEKEDTLVYENFKHWYRESGEKINIPLKKGAKELTDHLKKIGFKIVIISARPNDVYNRIFPDTLEWLNKNEIQYDALYFEKNKHLKILNQLPFLSFLIEDNAEYAKQIANLNYTVFLLNEKGDKEIENVFKDMHNVFVVKNLEEIKHRFKIQNE